LLGVYLTDGSLTDCNFNLQVIDQDFAENTLTYLRSIRPQSKAYLRIRTDKGSWNKSDRYVIKAGLGEYADWFRNQTNNKHHIPLCIWNANNGLKKWFIAGAMDGDGWISKTKRKGEYYANTDSYQYRIGIGGVKEGWIIEFRQLLSDLNVKCNKMETVITKDGTWFCRFHVNPKSFFDAGLFFTIKRKQDRCIVASTTAR